MKFWTTCTHFIDSCADKLSAVLCAIARGAEKLLSPVRARMPAVSRLFSRITPNMLFALLCAVSVLSQIDVVSAVGASRICVIIVWFLVFLLVAVKARLHIDKKALALIFPILIFDALILMIGLMKHQPMAYLGSPIVYSANLCAFVFLTGSLFAALSDSDLIISGAKVYVLCAVGITVYTILTTFSDVGFSSYLYAYSRKNSLAPIIVTAICCVMFIKPFRREEFHTPLLILFGTFMALLKSRANLIGLAAALIIWYFSAVKDKEARRRILLNVVTVACLVLAISTLRDLFIGNILLNHRADLGASGITSGRTDQIAEIIAAPEASGSYFTGNGYTYIESLPLAAMLSYGIFASAFLMLFAFVPLLSVRHAKRAGWPRPQLLFLFAISVAFLLNGILEERAPFGPGVTYFILWFCSGFFVSRPIAPPAVSVR